MKTETKIYTFVSSERLNNSVNGNPRYKIEFRDNDYNFWEGVTASDAGYVYGLSLSFGQEYRVTTHDTKLKVMIDNMELITIKDFELSPIDSRKSFYGKAVVYEIKTGRNIQASLVSYDTKVAEYKDGAMHIYGWYSATTARHINAFRDYYGFDKMTKKEMI